MKEIKIKSFRVKFKFHWEGEKNLTWEVITEKSLKVEQFRVWQRKAADSGRFGACLEELAMEMPEREKEEAK